MRWRGSPLTWLPEFADAMLSHPALIGAAWLMLPAALPSPPQNEWMLGPIPLRAYALAIMTGIVVASWLLARRWRQRGGETEQVWDVVMWAVPFGIVGGRIYHVITSPQAYFGPGGDPMKAFAIWEGGMGIWGAIALGALGAWIACRRQGLSFAMLADSIAPPLLIAQAIGRLGNWFNQELFGGPTTLPWGLQIDDAHLPAGFESGTLFHPTFLYELLWCLLGAGLLWWLDRNQRFRHGRLFWLMVAWYTLGRLWIETVRIDPANLIAGLRLNVWTSILVGLGALAMYVYLTRKQAREEAVTGTDAKTDADTEPAAETEPDDEPEADATSSDLHIDTRTAADTEPDADMDPAPDGDLDVDSKPHAQSD